MKKKYIFLWMALAFLLSSCIHDGLPKDEQNQNQNQNQDQNNTGQTITITGWIESPGTRISLEENGKNIDIFWEEGDKIQLGVKYIDNDGIQKSAVYEKVVQIDAVNKKKATFELQIPGDIKDKFDLYGLYGGKGLNVDDPSKANLPDTEDLFTNDLHTLYEKKVVMLYFEALNIDKTTPTFGVNFQHLGSFFKILVKNTGTSTIKNVTEAVLEQDGPTGQIPAYAQSDRFSIAGNYFLKSGAESVKTTSINFTAKAAFIVPNGILAFWAWLPVAKGEGDGEDWPGLRLKIKSGPNGNTETLTAYTQQRKATTGKAYHLYATHNGSTLEFVASNVIEVPDGTTGGTTGDTGLLADTRDGNLYATVRIGTQTWMQENLKYLPQVNNLLPLPTSYEEKRYFIYNFYSAPNLYAAKETDYYKTYGVLYNWAAAMNGANSSNTESGVSSGVQGACPPGWHIPSYEEWNDLGKYMSAERWTYDGTAYGPWSRIAKAMATGSPDWNSSAAEGAPGNTDFSEKINISKFTALPAGSADGNGNFANDLGKKALFWSSREYNDTKAYRREIKHNNPAVAYDDLSKRGGMSVRCLKDY